MDEELQYLIDDVDVIAPAINENAIQSVLFKLPRQVAVWAARNITFIDMSELAGVAVRINCQTPSESFNGESLGERLVVVLCHGEQHLSGETVSDNEREFTIAHEIGHHYCGHSVAHDKVAYEKAESEADAKANEWGFHGNSVRVL